MRKLTKKQRAFLDFLIQHVTEHKVFPTYQECGDHFGFNSDHSTTQYIQVLEEKRYLYRSKRGYSVVDLPDTILFGVFKEFEDLLEDLVFIPVLTAEMLGYGGGGESVPVQVGIK